MSKITIKSTPNQYALEGDVLAIILHTTLGKYEGAVEWLMMSPEERELRTGRKSFSSANAVFGRLGEITELAPPDRGTWHAGIVYKPSRRAKAILPKTIFGKLKNPNRRTLGLEIASGYDVDNDGTLENWERLYTPQALKECAWYILNVIEPKTGKQFGNQNILTHFDIDNRKPKIEIQRAMILMELSKQRKEKESPTVEKPASVEPEKNIIISMKEGEKTQKFICQPFKN